MQTPLQITFHQLEASPAVEARIHEKMAKLEQLHRGIVSGRVVVEPAAQQHGGGQAFYSVRFELGLGGGKTIVGGGPGQDAFDNVYAALKAAFDATRRQLHDHIEREREPVAAPPV